MLIEVSSSRITGSSRISAPINPPNSKEKRLERIHDLFDIIFIDHIIEDDEHQLIEKYAIGLGYTEVLAKKLIKRSIQIYTGSLNFEDYKYLVNKKINT